MGIEELHEMEEHAEHSAHDPSLLPVTFTMAVLAVVLAATTLLGHRAHTEELLFQSKATDQWAYYQAKNIREHTYEIFLDLLSVSAVKDPAQAENVKAKYTQEVARYKEELKEIETEAHSLESEVALRAAPGQSLRPRRSLPGSRHRDCVTYPADQAAGILAIGNSDGCGRPGNSLDGIADSLSRCSVDLARGSAALLRQ